MGQKCRYLGWVELLGYFVIIMFDRVPSIRIEDIYGIIWSPPQGKQFIALERVLTLEFPCSISTNILIFFM